MKNLIIIFFTSINIYCQIKLQESADFIISSIDDVAYYNGNYFLIDRISGDLGIYNEVGKLINFENASYHFSELAVNELTNDDKTDTLWVREQQVLPMNLSSYNLRFNKNKNYKDYYNLLKNYFGSICIKDDRIFLICHLYYHAFTIEGELIDNVMNQSAIFEYKIKNRSFDLLYINKDPLITKVYNQDISLRYYNLQLDNELNFYIQSINELYEYDSLNRKPIVLVKIDSNNIKTPILNLPKELLESIFNYSSSGLRIKFFKNELYYNYAFLPYIYKGDKKLFNLKPENEFQLNKIFKRKNNEIVLELLNEFEYFIRDFEIGNNNLFVLIRSRNNYKNPYKQNKYLLQKYDFNGKLLNQMEFNPHKRDIYKIYYNTKSKTLLIFYFEDESWFMEKIEL